MRFSAKETKRVAWGWLIAVAIIAVIGIGASIRALIGGS